MQFIFDTVTIRVSFEKMRLLTLVIILLPYFINAQGKAVSQKELQYRQRININDGWRFMRYTTEPDRLIYNERPVVTNRNDNVVADTKATDNGDPASMVSFASKEREAYFGLALVIVRSQKRQPGIIKIRASAEGLKQAVVEIKTK